MKRSLLVTMAVVTVGCPLVFAQDATSFGLKHQTVMAEDAKVRVVRYSPNAGDKTPMHSHPSYVVYVVKGGRVKYTLPDGTSTISDLKTGQVLLKPPVTHSDEALDPVETIIVELKQ